MSEGETTECRICNKWHPIGWCWQATPPYNSMVRIRARRDGRETPEDTKRLQRKRAEEKKR